MKRLTLMLLVLCMPALAMAYGQGKGGDPGKGNPDQGVYGCATATQASDGRTNNPHCGPVGPGEADLSCFFDGITLYYVNAGPNDATDLQITDGNGIVVYSQTVLGANATGTFTITWPYASPYTLESAQSDPNPDNNSCSPSA
ncbi:MAG TPA: hypothetical protein VJ998_06485 [Pseudomonadales bacterium]|nr:hypothetical protein [Pseudomonadales bacterium]